MASSGNTWMKKLEAKAARYRRRQHGNTFTPLMNRAHSSHAEKAQVFKQQKILMHGFREGNFINKGGVVLAPIFDGTGLPDEVIKAPKPKEDKRKDLPMKAGWAPKPYGKLNRRRLSATI